MHAKYQRLCYLLPFLEQRRTDNFSGRTVDKRSKLALESCRSSNGAVTEPTSNCTPVTSQVARKSQQVDTAPVEQWPRQIAKNLVDPVCLDDPAPRQKPARNPAVFPLLATFQKHPQKWFQPENILPNTCRLADCIVEAQKIGIGRIWTILKIKVE